MKFFIPDLDDVAEKGEELYQSIREKAADHWVIKERRIRSIEFRDLLVRNKKKPVKATVGRPDPLGYGIVLAILESTEVYLVYTTYRGVKKNEPLWINKDDVTDVEKFDDPL